MPRYSEQTLNHFHNPHRPGGIDGPDCVGQSGSTDGNGPFVIMHLQIQGERVSTASFQTYACPASIAAGSAVAKLAEGLDVRDALALSEGDIERELGGLPPNKKYLVDLAIRALRDALGKVGETRQAG